ncbi:MAG: guanylate kinase [Bacteroidales bacterium]|nr:guanylate kinase [Bacteroidales bacterium]
MGGKLLIFSAPSGSGKSTIVQHLVKLDLGLAFSISATSRQAREGEVDGREYHFISSDLFREKIDNNGFIEWEEVYPGQFYGTPKSEVDRIWNSGQHALFDIDVVGGVNLKKEYGEKALSVFVKPPSLQELEQRLLSRGTDDSEALKKRLGKAEYEMQFSSQFDHILVNDSLEKALTVAESLVRNFLAL